MAIFLQMAALSAFGLGQPLLQLVSRNSEFLVVHNSQGIDVILLAVALFLIPPVVFSVFVFGAEQIWPQMGRVIHAWILGGLFALTFSPIADQMSGVNGWVTIALIFVTSGFFVFLFLTTSFLRKNLAYLAIAIPVLFLLFMGSGSIRSIVFPDSSLPDVSDHSVKNPVVVVIFDEFPLSSLMKMDQEIDCELFPNFCRLASSSTWYRNATSVSGATLRSIPTILSGKFPVWSDSPSLENHPKNLFTLLGATHHVFAQEILTNLCPDNMKSEAIPDLGPRFKLLFEDLSVLYQHIVVPKALRQNLVPISSRWGHFLENTKTKGKGTYQDRRVEKFEDFIASIKTGNKPNLVFSHLLLPHVPFVYFPGGPTYNLRVESAADSEGVWGFDRVNAAHSYRRHILQVMAVDHLLGLLFDRLEKLDLFDDAAIIITSDHGATFRPGLPRRRFFKGNEADIMRVPLFFKNPGQKVGEINDCLAQSIDIFPTLVSVLECNPGWEFDGLDLQGAAIENRVELDFLDQDNRVELKFDPAILKDMNEIIQWKKDIFGEEGGIERLFAYGDSHGLLGQSLTGKQIAGHSILRGRILDTLELEKVDLEGAFVPAEFNGTITGHVGENRLNLALALNGKIAGVCETYSADQAANPLKWQILVPLGALKNGANTPELFLVPETYPVADLVRIPLSTPSFLGLNLGGSRVVGVQEKGLFKSNTWGDEISRWTDGQASWKIPLKDGEKPKMLAMKIVSSGPAGSNLKIIVNGTELLSQVLPRGKWETRLPLDSIDHKNILTVELISRVFIPSENETKSTDSRKLGVAITTLIIN